MRGFLIVVIMFCSSTLLGADGQWRWVKAENDTFNGWRTIDGYAEVVIDGGKFSAKLIAKGSEQNLEILLNGTIKDGKITAKETIQGSDYAGSNYQGAIEKKKWENTAGTVGAESITLSDGWSMIGITRAIPEASSMRTPLSCLCRGRETRGPSTARIDSRADQSTPLRMTE